MNLTRGSVFVDNSVHGSQYGTGLKNLIAVLVNNIPGLSIQTVTTNTSSNYRVTLNYKGLLFEVYNSNHKLAVKIGSYTREYYINALSNGSVVSFMYSDEGVMSFCMTCIAGSGTQNGNILSIIPVEFKLSDGTIKELFWFKYVSSYNYKLGNIPQFANSRAGLSINALFDPDSQTQYSFSISGGALGPVQQAKGKSVAVPLTFTNSYGTVTSYNIKGSSPLYYIYPGNVDILLNYYPGTNVVYIDNVPYIGLDHEYFIRM